MSQAKDDEDPAGHVEEGRQGEDGDPAEEPGHEADEEG